MPLSLDRREGGICACSLGSAPLRLVHSAIAVGGKYGNMPRAFARRRKAKRGPDKLDFADISLLLLRVHRQGFIDDEPKNIELTKEEKIADRSCWCSKRNSVRLLGPYQHIYCTSQNLHLYKLYKTMYAKVEKEKGIEHTF